MLELSVDRGRRLAASSAVHVESKIAQFGRHPGREHPALPEFGAVRC